MHTEGHDSVVIGVIDTGMRVGHEDLSNLNEYRRLGYNAELRCWEGSTGCTINDGYGHGTIVIGVAAATGNNNKGVSGIGWSLRHRMLYAWNSGDTLHAMWVSAEAGDRIICSTAGMLFDDENTWQLWEDNSSEIREQFDVLIVHIGGNRPDTTYPPFSSIISVGGTDQQDRRWVDGNNGDGSAVGDFIDVMAPATGIYSTTRGCDSCYGTLYDGTSYAAPQAAGLCALLWSYNPSLSADEVESLLFQGCDPIVDYDPSLHGHGRINVFNSLALASGSLWTRAPHPGTAGVVNSFKAAGATSSATVRFYY